MTIIGHHFLKQWELEKKTIGTKKKTQNKKEKMIVDVNAILLVKKKKEKNKPVVTTSKEITKISLVHEGNPGEVVEAISSIVGKGVVNVT